LPVEQDDVPVVEVSFHYVSWRERIGQGLPVAGEVEPDLYPVWSDDVICSGMLERTSHDELLEHRNVPWGSFLRNGELLGHLEWDTHFSDVKARVRTDHCPAGEVHPLPREGSSEATLLSLEALTERLEGPAGPVVGLGDSGDLVVEVGGYVIVEEVDQVLYDEVGGARLLALSHSLVDAEYVDYLVSEVVFGPDPGLEGY